MTKEDVVKKLTELSIDFDVSEKKAVLYALLPEAIRIEDEAKESAEANKSTEPVTVPPETPVVSPETVEPETPKSASLSVYNHNDLIRTYTLAQHGEQFEELAKEFAKKKGYSVR